MIDLKVKKSREFGEFGKFGEIGESKSQEFVEVGEFGRSQHSTELENQAHGLNSSLNLGEFSANSRVNSHANAKTHARANAHESENSHGKSEFLSGWILRYANAPLRMTKICSANSHAIFATAHAEIHAKFDSEIHANSAHAHTKFHAKRVNSHTNADKFDSEIHANLHAIFANANVEIYTQRENSRVNLQTTANTQTPPPKFYFNGFLNFIFIAFLAAFFALNLRTAKAAELSTFCTNNNTSCTISTAQSLVENHAKGGFAISLQANINSFINYGEMDRINFNNNSNAVISNFYNYGVMGNGGRVGGTSNRDQDIFVVNATTNAPNVVNTGSINGRFVYNNSSDTGTGYVTNSGTMTTGIQSNSSSNILVLDNTGVIGVMSGKTAHIQGFKEIHIKNYAFLITQNQSTFNAFTKYTNFPVTDSNTDKSHLVIAPVGSTYAKVSFDANAKIILRFGDGFEFNKAYALNKLILDNDGNRFNTGLTNEQLFERIVVPTNLYDITYSGENGGSFIAEFDTENLSDRSIVAQSAKQNLYAMSTLLQNSDNLLFRDTAIIKKQSAAKRTTKSARKTTKATSKKSRATKRATKPTKKATTRKVIRRGLMPNEIHYARAPQKITKIYDDSIVFVPFVSMSSDSEGLKMSGMSYGFVGVYDSEFDTNSFGIQLGYSTGEAKDADESVLTLKSTNLMFGLHFRQNFRSDVFLNLRADGFYFMNEIESYFAQIAKPNNYAAAVSADLGKSFGNFALLAGLDGRIYQQSEVNLENTIDASVSENYEAAMFNTLFIDIGAAYKRRFNKLSFDLNLGGKYNVLGENKANLMLNNATWEYSINEQYYIYGGLGLQYALTNSANLGLRYNANLGSQSTQHSGFAEFEWRW